MGTFIGAVPGTGCDIAAFVSYGGARRSSKTPEKFGTGILEGVAAPFMNYYGFPGSPILLALILGPMVEQNMRRSLMISHGDPLIFITRPISAAFIGVGLFVMITSYFRIREAVQRQGVEGARAEKGKVD